MEATVTKTIITPLFAPNPSLPARAPLAPTDPAFTQSVHVACRSSTNASDSGLSLPSEPKSSGLTTGVNHPSDEKCVKPLKLEEELEEEELEVLNKA